MAVSNIINLTIGAVAVGVGFLMFKSLPRPKPREEIAPTPEPSGQRDELPHLSVIIPARNESNRITPLLESLNDQNLESFEVLVVDDNSSDNTAAIAESFG